MEVLLYSIISPSPSLTLNRVLLRTMEKVRNRISLSEYIDSVHQQISRLHLQILQLSETRFNHVKVTLKFTFVVQVTEAYYIRIFETLALVSAHPGTSHLRVLELQGAFLTELPPGCEFSMFQDSYLNTKRVGPDPIKI